MLFVFSLSTVLFLVSRKKNYNSGLLMSGRYSKCKWSIIIALTVLEMKLGFNFLHILAISFLFQMSISNSKTVVLQSVSLNTSGVFRCEVSAEAPSFTSAQSEARMEVVCKWYFSFEIRIRFDQKKKVICTFVI